MPVTDAPPEPALAGAMSDTLSEMVDALVGIEATISALMAARTELLEGVRVWSELAESAAPHSTPTSRDLAFRSLRAELACALRLPESTVERLFGEARMLVRSLPCTMAALHAGEIRYRHAQVIVDHGAGFSPADLEKFERLAVPMAATSTPAAFDRAAHRLRESFDPSTIEARTRAAAEQREAVTMPARDGMAHLDLYLPDHDVSAIYTRATEEAGRRRKAGDPRTLTSSGST